MAVEIYMARWRKDSILDNYKPPNRSRPWYNPYITAYWTWPEHIFSGSPRHYPLSEFHVYRLDYDIEKGCPFCKRGALEIVSYDSNILDLSCFECHENVSNDSSLWKMLKLRVRWMKKDSKIE